MASHHQKTALIMLSAVMIHWFLNCVTECSNTRISLVAIMGLFYEFKSWQLLFSCVFSAILKKKKKI